MSIFCLAARAERLTARVERLLAMTEKPANIVRRRLEQAGWDPIDDFRTLATEDIQYLMKFVYKSNLLGPTVRRLLFHCVPYRSYATVQDDDLVVYANSDFIVALCHKVVQYHALLLFLARSA